jgi:hypothetical protein
MRGRWPIRGLAALAALLTAAALLGGRRLTARRKPDPADLPASHGLPFEPVSFFSRDWLLLRGWWIPSGETRSTVVLCHGQNGSMGADLAQARLLHEAGFNILMFNFRAHGDSEGKHVTFGLREKDDLFGALDYLARFQNVREVGVLGFSMGALTAILAAAETDRIRCIVADGTLGTLRTTLICWLRDKGAPKGGAAFFVDLILIAGSVMSRTRLNRVNAFRWMPRLRYCPVLFIHGADDELVPPEDVQTLAALAPAGSKLWIAPGCRHREAHLKHPDEYAERVIEWFCRYLAGPVL